MTIRTEKAWRADGAPWKLARPIAELRAAILVLHPGAADQLGTIGNKAHLSASPPEDHCPFSQTGYPVPSPYPYVHALDDQAPGFKERAYYWIAERRAGRAPWVKYINVDGWHYSWQPNERRTPSSDWKGHGHLSIRSDWTLRSLAYGWATVRRGAHGAGVTALQTMLHRNGDALSIDGVFGPDTERAVRRFQDHRRLVVDGVAGPRTRIALAIKG